MTTIQQLLNDKFSNKIPSPLSPLSNLSPHPGTPNLPIFPSPLFPHKAVSLSPHSFTNNIAAAASSHRAVSNAIIYTHTTYTNNSSSLR